MTWGFEATNEAGQVLISSATRNLHFVGKATLTTLLASFNGYGGLRHWAYRIKTPATPMPFMSMPTADFYGVAAVRQIDASLWEIEIIRSGTSDVAPDVYVFTDPRGATSFDSTFGMQVMHDDGTPSFDSRLRPLAVVAGQTAAPPFNPLVYGPGGLSARYCSSDAGYALAPQDSTSAPLDLTQSKPIFFFPSLAQAQRQFSYTERRRDCLGVNVFGFCIGYGETTRWTSTYWAFYRSGIRWSGNTLSCGWITVKYACNWARYEKGTLFGIGISGDRDSGGTWPYSNETLNLAPTAVIVADGNRYD